MKKHELIKAAYDNFPKGSKFHWGGFPITSTGEFHFNDETIVTSGSDIEYQVFDGKKFASLVKESILSGKCAIQVNNEREFKLLMEHYHSKGWKWLTQSSYNTVITEEYFSDDEVQIISYHDKCTFMNLVDDYNCEELGYKVIPFKDFDVEVGIKEQIKPNHVTIQLFHGFNCQIYKDGDIFIKNMTLKPSDLEDMLHAYKSLQS